MGHPTIRLNLTLTDSHISREITKRVFSFRVTQLALTDSQISHEITKRVFSFGLDFYYFDLGGVDMGGHGFGSDLGETWI